MSNFVNLMLHITSNYFNAVISEQFIVSDISENFIVDV